MRIDSSLIFQGDIRKIHKIKKDQVENEKIEIGYLKCRDTVLLKMGEHYVNISKVNNIFKYFKFLKMAKANKYNEDFLKTNFCNSDECVENIRPLFEKDGKYPLSLLHAIEKQRFEENYHNRGFECF